eukprot:m.213719 g.213719  ORF g.213719 m.213719 type:complete len:186 (-) comp15579_c0_seq3:337-894(-)
MVCTPCPTLLSLSVCLLCEISLVLYPSDTTPLSAALSPSPCHYLVCSSTVGQTPAGPSVPTALITAWCVSECVSSPSALSGTAPWCSPSCPHARQCHQPYDCRVVSSAHPRPTHHCVVCSCRCNHSTLPNTCTHAPTQCPEHHCWSPLMSTTRKTRPANSEQERHACMFSRVCGALRRHTSMQEA